MKIRTPLLLFVLALTLSFVLAACGNSNPSAETSSAADEPETVMETSQTEEPTEDVSEESPEATEPETAETKANDGNVLIAYFSHTGNTEEVAQKIEEYTGGTLAEIQRAEEYGDLQEEAEV